MTNPAARPAAARPAILHVHTDHGAGAHRTDSDDFIDWWCPTLGPTSSLLARLLARSVADTGAATWRTDELAGLLGLSTRQGGLWNSLERLAYFHVVTFVSTDTITVRVAMPALRGRQLDNHPHAAQYRPAPANVA